VISTDLHTGSMNGGMKDLPNVMSKILNLGLDARGRRSVVHLERRQDLGHPELGHLDVGAGADVTVLRLDRGNFGFHRLGRRAQAGHQLLVAEMTILKGAIVWDLNGRASQDWKTFPYKKRETPPAAAK
jgi:dihydroorotase